MHCELQRLTTFIEGKLNSLKKMDKIDICNKIKEQVLLIITENINLIWLNDI